MLCFKTIICRIHCLDQYKIQGAYRPGKVMENSGNSEIWKNYQGKTWNFSKYSWNSYKISLNYIICQILIA